MSQPPTLPSSLDGTSFHQESRLETFLRKLRQEPLIPFGVGLTCWALYKASRSIKAGDRHRTNRMFRHRIYAQAFTIVCMVGGSMYYAEERAQRKEVEGAVEERRAKEKQAAWIRELEVRDEEEKELAKRREAIREARERAAGRGSGDGTSFGSTSSTVDEGDMAARGTGVIQAVRELRLRWR